MNINYQKMLDDTINKLGEVKPKLLLHACCAPCSSGVLPVLAEHFRITLFFHNPNISPESEYDYRLKELYRLVEEMGYTDIDIVAPEYDEEEFLSIARGREELPEKQTSVGCDLEARKSVRSLLPLCFRQSVESLVAKFTCLFRSK